MLGVHHDVVFFTVFPLRQKSAAFSLVRVEFRRHAASRSFDSHLAAVLPVGEVDPAGASGARVRPHPTMAPNIKPKTKPCSWRKLSRIFAE